MSATGALTPTAHRLLERLPKYRNANIKQRARDYLIDGVKYARVTSALGIINKPGLVPWARNVTLDKVREVLTWRTVGDLDSRAKWVEKVIQEAKDLPDPATVAAELGTEAHGLIHRLLEGDMSAGEDIPEELRPAVHGAAVFLRHKRIQPVHTEFTVWDELSRIAGTIDGVGWRGDKLVIWDWKRSKRIYPEMALQLAEYAELMFSTTGYAVDEAWVVRLPQGSPELGEPLYEAKRVKDLGASSRTYFFAHSLQERLKQEQWAEGT